MAVVKKKKLYFNVSMTISATVGTVRNTKFLCTQFTNGTTGDRYGALLNDYTPLLTTAPVEQRRSRAVSAWFQCAQETTGSVVSNTAVGAVIAQLDFTGAANADSATPIAPPAGSGISIGGVETVFTRHFRVRLRATKAVTDTGSNGLRGVIYVQRQHSIEV